MGRHGVMLSIKRIRRYMTDNGPRAKREARVAAVTRMCARAQQANSSTQACRELEANTADCFASSDSCITSFQPCSQHRALPPLPQGGPSLSSLAHSGRDRSKPPRPCGPQAHPESPGGAVWRATQHCMSTEPCLPQRPSLSSLRRTAEGIGRNPPDRAGLRPIRSAPAARPGQPAHLTHRMSMPLNISPSEATTPHKLLTQR